MVLSLYSPGDLVVSKKGFQKCGRVIQSVDGMCHVLMDGLTVAVPTADLMLISVRNIPNLRLINQKVTDASSALANADSLGHAIMGYLGGGTVVSRAFADYILKVSPGILAQCLTQIHHANADIPHAIDQVLGLNFQFISGE